MLGLTPGTTRYTLLLNDKGGIRDGLMVTRTDEDGKLFVIVNAACKHQDFAHIKANMPKGVTLTRLDRGLIALQGPKATDLLARFAPAAANMDFMTLHRSEEHQSELQSRMRITYTAFCLKTITHAQRD